MDERTWDLLVATLVRQGVVADEAEAVRRLEAGEELLVNLPVAKSEWRGLYGTVG